MATVIRLKRGGRTHAPYYRVVVMDSRTRLRGREVDLIGYYHPCARPEPVTEIDAEKALKWLNMGAQPSNTVRSLFSKRGIMAAFAAGEATPEEAAPVSAEEAVADAAGETTVEAAEEEAVPEGADEALPPLPVDVLADAAQPAAEPETTEEAPESEPAE